MKKLLVMLVSGLFAVSCLAGDQVMSLALLSDGAVATVDVGKAVEKAKGKTALRRLGNTVKNIAYAPVELAVNYPKTTASLAAITTTLLVGRNNEWFGLQKDKDAGSNTVAGGAGQPVTSRNQSINNTVSGNSGPVIIDINYYSYNPSGTVTK